MMKSPKDASFKLEGGPHSNGIEIDSTFVEVSQTSVSLHNGHIFSKQKTGSNTYSVKASEGAQIYHVTLLDQRRPEQRCVPQCTEPECLYLCRHQITCTCRDYQQRHLCTHCHKVRAMDSGEDESEVQEDQDEPLMFNPPTSTTKRRG